MFVANNMVSDRRVIREAATVAAAGFAVDAHTHFHLGRADVEGGLAGSRHGAAGERHTHRARGAVHPVAQCLEALEVGSLLSCGTDHLLDHQRAGNAAAAGGVERVFNGDVVIGDDGLDDSDGDDEIDDADVDPVVACDPVVVLEAQPLIPGALPASVYMLVDKTVELQAKPLKDFPELGLLPEDEQERQALMLYSNPRQAKRQCGRTQRVIKVPDSGVLERTSSYLLAQGITRLVVEGGSLYAIPGS